MSEPAGVLGAGPIIVGIKPGLPDVVIDAAVQTALAFDCEVIFAYVELNSALVELDSVAQRKRESLEPDVDEEMAGVVGALAQSLTRALEGAPVPWTFRTLAGDPASALSRLAAEEGARMFLIGTRRPGPVHRIEEFLSGSIASKLALGQTRPVLVIPISHA